MDIKQLIARSLCRYRYECHSSCEVCAGETNYDTAETVVDALFTPEQQAELSKPGSRLVVQCADQTIKLHDMNSALFAEGYAAAISESREAGFVKVVGG